MSNLSERLAEVCTSPPGSAEPWLPMLQLYPGRGYWQVAVHALLANAEQLAGPGIHASELTHRDVSQEASWEVGGSQEESDEVEREGR